MAEKTKPRGSILERFSSSVARWTGGSTAFALACSVIVVWIATGPIFQYSDTWQLIINTGTTIVTFLMVFLIQQSQNRDTLALQVKLAELIIAVKGAKNQIATADEKRSKIDPRGFVFSAIQHTSRPHSNAAGSRIIRACL